jgi:DNA-binding response OmpR family regulator
MTTSPDILKARILIVDEEPDDICLLEQMLRSAGYVSISSTRNPREVCELHRDYRYSLILFDFQMPGMDAIQMMEGLKALEIGGDPPVLVITARPEQKLRALEAGARDFLGKPFDWAEVLTQVRNLLEGRLLRLETVMSKEQAEERFIEAQKRKTIAGPWPRGTETVLVVEDEPSVRELARHVLTAQGYKVLTAVNGQEALQVAREHKGEPIRLVFTDVIMPLMGGKMMTEWLATAHPGLKILFTSGYTDKVIGHHGGLGAGASFLPKPYTPAALSSKVREILDQPKDASPAPRRTHLPTPDFQMVFV